MATMNTIENELRRRTQRLAPAVLPGASRDSKRPVVDASAAFRNVRMMRLLSRIGHAFNQAGVEVLMLKGAALNLTLYRRADERAMDDLDLLVQPTDIDAACLALEKMGGLRGESQVREDFFPRFHYEIEYTLGRIYPVKIDLHVRPFRPLRFSQTVPNDAFWADAEVIDVGGAKMLHPAPDDMLIHLTAHCAIHGNGRDSWLTDIARWIEQYGSEIDWDRFVRKASSWRLVHAVRFALDAVEKKFGAAIPTDARSALDKHRVTWRDRLTVMQAPHDAARPVRHVLVSALCTPRLRFVASYLWGMAIPDRGHMADWYRGRHFGWLPTAHLLRFLGPILNKLPKMNALASGVQVRRSRIHGVGVFATRSYAPGAVVARYWGRRVDHAGMYVVTVETPDAGRVRYELTGDLKHLNHSCTPNAKITRCLLSAVRPVDEGEELTIDYGTGTCDCEDRVVGARTGGSACGPPSDEMQSATVAHRAHSRGRGIQ